MKDKKYYSIMVLFMIALTAFICSCDQTKADFPDDLIEPTNECGSWYAVPGDAGVDAGPDGNDDYAVEKGKTFPCLVWESVSHDEQETWFNVGDLYLSFKYDVTNAKALVIPVVGIGCAGCIALIKALSSMEEEFSKVAVMVALTHGALDATTNISLSEAVTRLSQEGWPSSWYITNDVENHFPKEDYNGIPWVVVVRLSDMKVVERSNIRFTGANPKELLEFIENL